MLRSLITHYFNHQLVMVRWFHESVQCCPQNLRPVLMRLSALGAVVRTLPLLHHLSPHQLAGKLTSCHIPLAHAPADMKHCILID